MTLSLNINVKNLEIGLIHFIFFNKKHQSQMSWCFCLFSLNVIMEETTLLMEYIADLNQAVSRID